eukprot:GEMP01042842.1.p1 GENE.GEMP01042842.1~~GEMP01042842.1.p1  ORF type:complete len:473 (+),score=97.15 GEMP01042842.1:242-1660(+)
MSVPTRSPRSRMAASPSFDGMSQAASLTSFPRWRQEQAFYSGLLQTAALRGALTEPTVADSRKMSRFYRLAKEQSMSSDPAFGPLKHAGSHMSYLPMAHTSADLSSIADAFLASEMSEKDDMEACSQRGYFYNFLENPELSMSAKAIETTDWGYRQAAVIFNLELIFTIFFTSELSLRLIASFQEQDWRYFVSWTSVIDILATSPGWADIYLSLSHGDNAEEVPFEGLAMVRCTRIIRVLRALRILRLAQLAARSELLLLVYESFYCLRDSAFIFICLIVMSSILSAAVVYFAEVFSEPDGDAAPQITSIPMALWWSITTLTTTGYGDIVPVTSMGRTVGSVTMILGVLVNSICVAIISVAFTDEYHQKIAERKFFLMATEHLSTKPEVYELTKEWHEYSDNLENYYGKLERKLVDSSMLENDKEVLRYLVTQLRQTTTALNSQAQFVLDRFDLLGPDQCDSETHISQIERQ